MLFFRTAVAFTLSLYLSGSAMAYCFEEAGKEYNLSPFLLWTLATHESRMNPRAVNWNTDGSYDFGLMGINTVHAKDLERSGITWNSLADPCTNVKVGASILSKCFAKYGDTWEGVGCYNSQTPSKRNRYAKLIYNLIEREKAKQKQQPAAQTQVTSLQPQPANETSPWLLIESDYVSR